MKTPTQSGMGHRVSYAHLSSASHTTPPYVSCFSTFASARKAESRFNVFVENLKLGIVPSDTRIRRRRWIDVSLQKLQGTLNDESLQRWLDDKEKKTQAY